MRAGIFLVIWALSCPLWAADAMNKETEEKGLKLAKEFADCAAVFDIYARLDSNTDQEFALHHVHELANGALASSKYMFGLVGYGEGYAQSIYETQLSAWGLLVKNGELEEYTKKTKFCMSPEVNGVQGEIIDRIRRQVYKKKD